MAWTELHAVQVSVPEHNADVADAIAAVRDCLAAVDLAYLDPSAVTVDAEPEYRAAFFSVPHTGDGSVVELRHGDGYTYLKTPIGEYHGYVDDHDLGAFLAAALTGRLERVVRLRGAVTVEHHWRWRRADGSCRVLDRRVRWRAMWRVAWPAFSDSYERRALDFGQNPAAVRVS